MKRRASFGAGVLAFLATAAAAGAQVAGFDAADYGRAQLPLRQSVGNAADFIAANKGAFEPVGELDRQDPLFRLARPIGRIDVILRDTRTGTEMGTACTGALLPGDLVLTNHHCLPVSGAAEPVKASILMDYLSQDGAGAQRFELVLEGREADAGLDFALARVKGAPGARYGTATLSGAAVAPGQSLIVIHHPLGRPKVISRFRCLALREQGEGPDLRHRCDTLGGSSGSLMFDAAAQAVALHKEGGLDPQDAQSFNGATRMAAILARSATLARIAGAVPAGGANPAPAGKTKIPSPAAQTGAPAPGGSLSAGEMTDVLRR